MFTKDLSSLLAHTRSAALNLVRCAALPAVLTAGLASCHGGYTYTLNDSVIYSPNPAPDVTVLRDTALQACLNQYIGKSEPAGKLEDVHLLACPSSGVTTLTGIDALSNLEELELSDNNIKDLRPLVQLRYLRVVSLRNNPVKSIAPLLSMTSLRFVALQGDEQLPCTQVAKLKEKLGNALSEPLHCKR